MGSVPSSDPREFKARSEKCDVETEGGRQRRADVSTLKCPEYKPIDRISQQLLGFAEGGNATMVRVTLLHGANIETRRPMVLYQGESDLQAVGSVDQQGMTPLMHAAQGGHLRCVEILLQWGADVHAREEDGLQPLHFAAHSGNIDVASALINAGADGAACDHSGKTVLAYLPESTAADPVAVREWCRLLENKPMLPLQHNAGLVTLPSERDTRFHIAVPLPAKIDECRSLDDTPLEFERWEDVSCMCAQAGA